MAACAFAAARSNGLFIDMSNAASEIWAVGDALPAHSQARVIPYANRFHSARLSATVHVQARSVAATQR